MKKVFIAIIIIININVYAQTAADYYKQANEKFLKNDFGSAEKDYTKAIELNPKFIDAYINRGRLKHNKFKDDKGAIKDYNKVIELDQKNADAYYYRGNAKRNLKDFKGACIDWAKAVELGNMDAKVGITKYCK